MKHKLMYMKHKQHPAVFHGNRLQVAQEEAPTQPATKAVYRVQPYDMHAELHAAKAGRCCKPIVPLGHACTSDVLPLMQAICWTHEAHNKAT